MQAKSYVELRLGVAALLFLGAGPRPAQAVVAHFCSTSGGDACIPGQITNGCPSGNPQLVPDCDLKCVYKSWIGDGVCDWSPGNINTDAGNFNCSKVAYDGGDCEPPDSTTSTSTTTTTTTTTTTSTSTTKNVNEIVNLLFWPAGSCNDQPGCASASFVTGRCYPDATASAIGVEPRFMILNLPGSASGVSAITFSYFADSACLVPVVTNADTDARPVTPNTCALPIQSKPVKFYATITTPPEEGVYRDWEAGLPDYELGGCPPNIVNGAGEGIVALPFPPPAAQTCIRDPDTLSSTTGEACAANYGALCPNLAAKSFCNDARTTSGECCLWIETVPLPVDPSPPVCDLAPIDAQLAVSECDDMFNSHTAWANLGYPESDREAFIDTICPCMKSDPNVDVAVFYAGSGSGSNGKCYLPGLLPDDFHSWGLARASALTFSEMALECRRTTTTTPPPLVCDDGDICHGISYSFEANLANARGCSKKVFPCDDGDPTTIDTCDSNTQRCSHQLGLGVTPPCSGCPAAANLVVLESACFSATSDPSSPGYMQCISLCGPVATKCNPTASGNVLFACSSECATYAICSNLQRPKATTTTTTSSTIACPTPVTDTVALAALCSDVSPANPFSTEYLACANACAPAELCDPDHPNNYLTRCATECVTYGSCASLERRSRREIEVSAVSMTAVAREAVEIGARPARCIPNCDGRSCGGDSCGGTCGTCDAGTFCIGEDRDGTATVDAGSCTSFLTCDPEAPKCSFVYFNGSVLPGCGINNYCASDCTCQDGNGLPDLVMDADAISASVMVQDVSFAVDSCAVKSGCVDAAGVRRIVRFDATVFNQGQADFSVDSNIRPDKVIWSECAGGYAFNAASYKLMDATGSEYVLEGHTHAYQLTDSFRQDPSSMVGCSAKYPTSTSSQGLQRGWAHEKLFSDCSWIDITGIPAGSYVLELKVNPFGAVAESTLRNNVVKIRVQIGAWPVGSLSEMEKLCSVPMTATNAGFACTTTTTVAPGGCYQADWSPGCRGYTTCGYTCVGSECGYEGNACPCDCDKCAVFYPGQELDTTTGRCIDRRTPAPTEPPIILTAAMTKSTLSDTTIALVVVFTVALVFAAIYIIAQQYRSDDEKNEGDSTEGTSGYLDISAPAQKNRPPGGRVPGPVRPVTASPMSPKARATHFFPHTKLTGLNAYDAPRVAAGDDRASVEAMMKAGFAEGRKVGPTRAQIEAAQEAETLRLQQELDEQIIAATKIQAGFRGHKGRQEFTEKQKNAAMLRERERQERLAEENRAATKIQAGFRGKRGRDKARSVAEEKRAPPGFFDDLDVDETFSEADIGEAVNVDGYGRGILRYFGPHKGGKKGDRAGVEMDLPVGLNNGSTGGNYYFTCEPKYGVVVAAKKVSKL